MSDATATYLRCRHCKGFYETSFDGCKWCKYDTPVLAGDGTPRVYPDRATCRAIQIAEYEQLPAEAREDYMGPPIDEPDLKCGCLHCGQDGHQFEVIEMRWIANERMWACPCTTCGGRGYEIDIHEIESRWECANCGHKYRPADGRFIQANVNCPKCGCTEASGWFDDEDEFDDEEDDDLEDDGEEEFPDDTAVDLPRGESTGVFEDNELPWDDEDDGEGWKRGAAMTDEDDEDGLLGTGEDPMPDDIDFPRQFDELDDFGKGSGEIGPDDIPF
jgi:hypothetical protein